MEENGLTREAVEGTIMANVAAPSLQADCRTLRSTYQVDTALDKELGRLQSKAMEALTSLRRQSLPMPASGTKLAKTLKA